jgi:hypothetical protein
VTLECDVWVFTDLAKTVPAVLRRARLGETFKTIAANSETVGVRVDGRPAWLKRECVTSL